MLLDQRIFAVERDGVEIEIECVVPPTTNVLALSWRVRGWTDSVATGTRGPLWFGLTRWADPSIEDISARLAAHYRYTHLHRPAEAGIAFPLKPPELCTVIRAWGPWTHWKLVPLPQELALGPEVPK